MRHRWGAGGTQVRTGGCRWDTATNRCGALISCFQSFSLTRSPVFKLLGLTFCTLKIFTEVSLKLYAGNFVLKSREVLQAQISKLLNKLSVVSKHIGNLKAHFRLLQATFSACFILLSLHKQWDRKTTKSSLISRNPRNLRNPP